MSRPCETTEPVTQVAAALAAGRPGVVDRVALLSPTLAPAVRGRLRWLRVPPARAGAGVLPTSMRGRRRVGLLAGLSRLPRGSQMPPLEWDTARRYLASGNVIAG